MYAATSRSPAPVASTTGTESNGAVPASTRSPSTDATAPLAPSVTTTVGTTSPRIRMGAARSSAPDSTSASPSLTNSARAADSLAGGRPANARASSSPQVTEGGAPSGTTYSRSRLTDTARGDRAATSAALDRTPGSTVTIA